jgi:nitrogen-specific signal transduction histidine kinase
VTGELSELTYALPEAHLIVSLRGEIQAGNPAAATLFGQSMAEMAGRQLADAIGAEAVAVDALLRTARAVRTLIPEAVSAGATDSTMAEPSGVKIAGESDGWVGCVAREECQGREQRHPE